MTYKIRGFTLVELMVVLAIVGILSAIAVPNYMQYLITSRRSDAYSGLYDIIARQQACFTTTGAYCTAVNGTAQSSLGFATSVNTSINSPQNYYVINVSSIGQSSPTSYMINASVNSSNGQSGDTECAIIGIDDKGVRYGWNNGGTAVTDCWQ